MSSIEDPTVLGRLLDAQAVALEQLGDTDAARAAYARAREVFASAGYAPGVASVENHLGDLDLSAGDLAAAAAHFSLGTTTAEAAGDGASVAMASLNLALIEHLRGQPGGRTRAVRRRPHHQPGVRRPREHRVLDLRARPDRARKQSTPQSCTAAPRTASRRLEIMLSALEQRLQAEELERLCASLGPERFGQRWSVAATSLVDDIIAAAIERRAPAEADSGLRQVALRDDA